MTNKLKNFSKNKSTTEPVVKLLEFIEKELPNFPGSNEFINILAKKKNENQHSLSFCAYMTNKCKSHFYFARENSQYGSSTIDIGVYKGSILFFTIEAKLLPIPSDPDRNEYEYVYGSGAGIQRFKDCKHGLDNENNLLPENGLIAYIKDKDFEHWHTQINRWVCNATWPENESLQKDYFNTIAKLNSTHKREDGTDVRLHHFWIKVMP